MANCFYRVLQTKVINFPSAETQILHHFKKLPMKKNLSELGKVIIVYILILFTIICIWSCNSLKKSESMVLASRESVERVRAATDDLFKCANDSIVFIHDSTEVTNTEYQRDTLIESRNDTTFINYFDTAIVTKTVTKTLNTVITDNREVNKLKDSLTNIRLREASFSGQILSKENDLKKANKSKNLWFIISLFSVALLLIIGVMTIYKTLTNILPIRK